MMHGSLGMPNRGSPVLPGSRAPLSGTVRWVLFRAMRVSAGCIADVDRDVNSDLIIHLLYFIVHSGASSRGRVWLWKCPGRHVVPRGEGGSLQLPSWIFLSRFGECTYLKHTSTFYYDTVFEIFNNVALMFMRSTSTRT